MTTFRMPSLGADMERGTITEWHVQPGDHVTRGQIVATVDTEKADIEVEVFADGVIGEILVPVGVEVEVGAPLATILGATEEATAPPPAAPPPAPVAAPPAGAPRVPRTRSPLVRHLAEELHVDLATVTPSPDGVVHRVDVERAAAHAAPLPPTTRPRAATPRARRLAAERGIDLATVTSRHADGAIHADDLDTAQPATPGTAAPSTAPPPTPAAPGDSAAKLQRAVGRLMERSKREIPHYYLSHEIDCQRALAWLEARNADRPVTERVLPAALLLRATVLALTAVPECNGHYVDGEFVPATHVHLGVAVSTRGGGLLSPVIAHAETLTLDELMVAMRDIVNRTRGGTLRSSDTDQATVTVTNLGDQGTDRVFGVIVPPQVAIIGFGRITERPWARDGMLAVHRTVTASLSADHRVSHGHRGAKLLTTMAAVLDEPGTRL